MSAPLSTAASCWTPGHRPFSRLRVAGAALVLALAGLIGACDLAFSSFREEATDTWSKTFPLAETGRLEIANTNGRISVVAGSGATVDVKVVKRARGATKENAESALKQIEILEQASADRVRLETKAPKMRGGGTSVDYTVSVPPGATVSLQTVNGGIDIASVSGAVDATTTNGQVEGKGLRGAVKASTTNGRVDVELAALSGDVSVGTTNGSVSLRMPAAAKADVALEVTNGSVALDGFSVDGEQERRRVRGRVNGGGFRVEAETVNGSISVAAAK